MLNIFGKKFDRQNLGIFLLFGMLHAAILIIIDHTDLIPANIVPFPISLIEQFFSVFMVFFLLSYNGYKSGALLARSILLAIIACVPSASYAIIEFKLHSISHNGYNLTLLVISMLMCLFVNYSYHKYNSLYLHYYQIYDAIYTSIAKIILAALYLLLIMVCGIMLKAVFILLGNNMLHHLFEHIIFRKCYISVAAGIAMWIIYHKEYIAEHLSECLTTACYYAYWFIAPMGLIFILAYLYSSFLFLALTNISYGLIISICFISMICNMKIHAEESHWKPLPDILKAVTNIYNKILPILPILLLYNLFFHFGIDTGTLACQAHIMDTGVHWSNVAILVITAFLIINNTIAAIYTSEDMQTKNNTLPVVAWYSFYAIIVACYIIFVFHTGNLEHSVDHIAKCDHFKDEIIKMGSITNIRYLA